MPSTVQTLAAALAGAATAAAHGYVKSLVINGVEFSGYDVTNFPYRDDAPVVVGWSSEATDLGFVAPDAFSDADIICHKGSQNAQGFAEVAAGDSIYIQWNTWPDSHHGPVIDYLASCGDAGCASVDKTTLEFFKISEVGLVDGSAAPGTYGSDQLLNNGVGWMVQIPEGIAPGDYVLRHEIIALHSAGQENGAQNYPQCFSLRVTGGGSQSPQGTLGTELYTANDDGILFNIYTPLDSYPIPGPALISGASAVSQATSAVQSTGTATQGSGSAPATTSAAAQPTSADAEPTATPAPTAAPSNDGGDSPAATTTSQTQQPEATKTPDTCALKKRNKRSKKVRRHVRDVKALNVAPIRN